MSTQPQPLRSANLQPPTAAPYPRQSTLSKFVLPRSSATRERRAPPPPPLPVPRRRGATVQPDGLPPLVLTRPVPRLGPFSRASTSVLPIERDESDLRTYSRNIGSSSNDIGKAMLDTRAPSRQTQPDTRPVMIAAPRSSSILNARGLPRPVSRPHPPIHVARTRAASLTPFIGTHLHPDGPLPSPIPVPAYPEAFVTPANRSGRSGPSISGMTDQMDSLRGPLHLEKVRERLFRDVWAERQGKADGQKRSMDMTERQKSKQAIRGESTGIVRSIKSGPRP